MWILKFSKEKLKKKEGDSPKRFERKKVGN